MHPVVNHMIQLQDLLLIRDEQKVAGGVQHLEQLDASIKAMMTKLPGESREHFEKLLKKDRIVVTPLADGSCAGCGMRLPSSVVQAVRQARELQVCPNCTRILYDTALPVRRVGRNPRRSERPKAGISRFSSESLMLPALEAADAEGAIRELAVRMEQGKFIDDAERVVELALRREAVLSTAVDHGLAFPHVRNVQGGGLTLALGLSRGGIAFDGQTGKPTRIVFFLAIPTAASAFYLKLLAGLTETFRDAAARKTLMAGTTSEELWKVLVKLTRKTVK
jgi:mannitol/fructose-specific phosphotransferase system IIA component (Ntr-type)